MDEIQFMFRPDKGDDSSLITPRNYEAGAAAMDNERFFSFFDHVLPQSGAQQQALLKAGGIKHGSPKTKGTVLIVDDSALARKVVCNILLASGYQVAEAKDGFEAMGQLENVHPDLVVLDLIMPKMDGYQVVEMMKKTPVYQKTPIIMLTSRDSLMDKLRGKMSASDAYITKPVKEEDLMAQISRLLDQG
jgi:CheY-like chemotaxis protein